MGGIAGASEDAITIYKSVNHGNITINRNAKYYGAGGILGYVKQGGAHIRYCCNRANIDYPKDKEDSHGIGGIVGSIEKASDNDDSYVLDCYNMGEINGQQKATGTLGSDYRGGIVGNLGSHGRCYRGRERGLCPLWKRRCRKWQQEESDTYLYLARYRQRLWSNVYPPTNQRR